MRKPLLLLLGACVAVPTVATTPAASADPAGRNGGREVQGPNVSGIIQLPSVGGYRVTLAMPNKHLVRLTTQRLLQEELGGSEKATYAVRPETPLASGVLRAGFGAIGHLALRFKPSGIREVGRGNPDCEGRRPVTEWGSYHGTVELLGEGGYFEVSAKSVKGTRRRAFRVVCDRGRAMRQTPEPLHRYADPALGFGLAGKGLTSLLRVEAEADGRSVALRTAGYGFARYEMRVGVLESRPDMAIGRRVWLYSPLDLVKVTPGTRPTTASFRPFAPFSGEGSYVDNPAAADRWTGTLGVNFPALYQPLTGSGFVADLCVQELRAPQSCVREDRRLLIQRSVERFS